MEQTMEELLRQAFLYYDREGVRHLSLEDTEVVLRSANVAVDLDDVTYYMNAEYAEVGQKVERVTWDACLQMARSYSGCQVGKAKVRSALKAFELVGDDPRGSTGPPRQQQQQQQQQQEHQPRKPVINVQELHHCLRALTPASVFVTGSDVAAFALRGVTADSDGTAAEEDILSNF